jgi:dTDP-4-dehydrorhamnose 3,5-epimerase
LRGLHYQRSPHEEAKLVRCVRGRVYDVVVDLRPDSPQRGRWCAVELSEANRAAVFVPRGCAHGFQALDDATELLYLIDTEYAPESAEGVRWDDPTLAIAWPLPNPILSARDQGLPFLA